MKIIISGASGLIGTALEQRLTAQGHEVVRLVRRAGRPQDILWDVEKGVAEPSRLNNCQVIVHLAGESIAEGRWTEEKKKRIRDSRVLGTARLSRNLAQLEAPPPIFVNGSAIGFYGDRGASTITEESSAGTGFLAEVCQEWEAAAQPAIDAGLRVAHLRTGIVLSPKGGALAKMLLPFKFGVGGKIGDGTQYMSWIALEDLLSAIEHIITHDSLRGPVNGTAPNPATNAELTEKLGAALHRPTFFSVPAFAARLAFGEMADEALLGGAKVLPARLLASGFQFKYPELASTLKHLLA